MPLVDLNQGTAGVVEIQDLAVAFALGSGAVGAVLAKAHPMAVAPES